MGINIGIKHDNKNLIAKDLNNLLSNIFVLYVKTLNFHWNVTGEKFQPLHELFEEQYLDLANSLDVVAERIRALGYRVPATISECASNSFITEVTGDITEEEMIQSLVKDNESVSTMIRKVLDQICHLGDEATIDILNKRLTKHDEYAWVLRSFFNQGKKEIK